MIKCFIFLFCHLISFCVFSQDCSGDLTMQVEGFSVDGGQIKFDLDNSEETFEPKENGKASFMKGKAAVENKKAQYVFKNIPCGEYAIKLYHDANMNETLDFNFIKIPKESFGFSNCRGCLLPPRFSRAKFLFDKEHTSIIVYLD